MLALNKQSVRHLVEFKGVDVARGSHRTRQRVRERRAPGAALQHCALPTTACLYSVEPDAFGKVQQEQ